MKTPDCAYWLGKLANLNAARTAGLGIAPHKPLMLLTLCDLIESGDIADRWIVYTPRLVTQFRGYWDLVIARRKNRPDITMPFNALGGERDAIWDCYDINGNPSRSKLTTRLCHLNASLFECLCRPEFRREARRTLAAGYFTPTEQVGLCERLRIPLPDTAEIEELKKDANNFRASRKKGRDSRFKSEVGAGYKYTCALTGYSLQTTEGYLVEAAHIHQHARSGNDDPANGLALTPDAHWMFDAGLWTAIPQGNSFLIRVAIDKFTESSPHSRLLAAFDQKFLHFHADSRLRPDPRHLEWHRQHHRL